VCIIFKKIESIIIVMQIDFKLSTKLTKNPARTKNIITRTTALVIIGSTMILLSSSMVGVINVWADNFFGTPRSDTLDGTDGDDNIFGLGGNDRISDGFGSDRILAGSGDDAIRLDGIEEGAEESGQDMVYGESGRDSIESRGEYGFRLIFGGADDDTITAGGNGFYHGRIYGDSGDDDIRAGGDLRLDVWGGPGDDEIDGASECAIRRAYGGSGNDRIISPSVITRGGSGNDFIQFADCGGIAFGDSGNDELRGGEQPVELHGGSGNDKLVGGFDNGDDELFGDKGDDTLTGRDGADSFDCGPGTDIITDFNEVEGDTKTENCENVLEPSVSVLENNDRNVTTAENTTSTLISDAVVGDSAAPEVHSFSLSSATVTSSSDDNVIEKREASETVEAQTMEMLPDEKPQE
jgi:Ca2+-binding RTX toxin-like protein